MKSITELCYNLQTLLCQNSDILTKDLYCLGLIAKVIDRTKTMDDVYGAFYDFSCMLETKVCMLVHLLFIVGN